MQTLEHTAAADESKGPSNCKPPAVVGVHMFCGMRLGLVLLFIHGLRPEVSIQCTLPK